MDAIFLKLLNMSIAAGWLIAAVAVLRLFMRKAPRWIPCVLWAIVAVRLICLFAPESSLSLLPRAEFIRPGDAIYSRDAASDNSVFSLTDRFADSRTDEKDRIGSGTDSPHTDFSNTDLPDKDFSNADFPDTDFSSEGTTPADWLSRHSKGAVLRTLLPAACRVWQAGVCIMLACALISLLRVQRSVRAAVPLRDRIWLCDTVRSPFILGLLRPRIYLPSGLSPQQLPYVLAHEQAHLRHRDHWWKFLGYLLLTIYWFQPLVWAAYILFCRDIELACDEKAIRDMNFSDKKAYASTLVSCSVRRPVPAVSPLAFGEVGVRERVKLVLHYKKPAFWLVVTAAIACAAVAVCFLTNPRTDAYDIKIVIPAGSQQYLHYSDMEISPTRRQIVLSAGEGLGDTEVDLLPVEVSEENAYDETVYMTPGLSVKMDVEKGAWFKIGVSVSNPTNEDIVVYVHAENVNVRIASAETPDKIQYMGQWYDRAALSPETVKWLEWFNSLSEEEQRAISYEPADLRSPNPDAGTIDAGSEDASAQNGKADNTAASAAETMKSTELPPDNLDDAVAAAILAENASTHTDAGDFVCCDFVPLATLSATPPAGETTHIITSYGWALYAEYKISDAGIEDLGGSHIPVMLTFTLNENGYQLQEYWKPREGSYYTADIRETFLPDIVEDALDSQKYIAQQIQSCYKQAVEANKIDTDAVIQKLLDDICSPLIASSKMYTTGDDILSANPNLSSGPQDYIDFDPVKYRELIYYGEYTLRYCLNRFFDGDETHLEGHIMARVCETLLQTEGTLPLDAAEAETGQLWFDTLLAHGSNRIEPYLNSENAEKLTASSRGE